MPTWWPGRFSTSSAVLGHGWPDEKPTHRVRVDARRSGDGRTALTDQAFFRVRCGEPIRTQYEIPAPIVDNSSCQLSGRGFSVPLGRPRFQYEKTSRAERLLRD